MSTPLPFDQILAAFMFAGMIAFLFLGFPVAFSLTFTGFLFGGLGIVFGFLRPDFLDILPIRIWGTMSTRTCSSCRSVYPAARRYSVPKRYHSSSCIAPDVWRNR